MRTGKSSSKSKVKRAARTTGKQIKRGARKVAGAAKGAVKGARKANPVTEAERKRMRSSSFALPKLKKYALIDSEEPKNTPARANYALTLLNQHFKTGARSKREYVEAYVNIMRVFKRHGKPAKRPPLVRTTSTLAAYASARAKSNPVKTPPAIPSRTRLRKGTIVMPRAKYAIGFHPNLADIVVETKGGRVRHQPLHPAWYKRALGKGKPVWSDRSVFIKSSILVTEKDIEKFKKNVDKAVKEFEGKAKSARARGYKELAEHYETVAADMKKTYGTKKNPTKKSPRKRTVKKASKAPAKKTTRRTTKKVTKRVVKKAPAKTTTKRTVKASAKRTRKAPAKTVKKTTAPKTAQVVWVGKRKYRYWGNPKLSAYFHVEHYLKGTWRTTKSENTRAEMLKRAKAQVVTIKGRKYRYWGNTTRPSLFHVEHKTKIGWRETKNLDSRQAVIERAKKDTSKTLKKISKASTKKRTTKKAVKKTRKVTRKTAKKAPAKKRTRKSNPSKDVLHFTTRQKLRTWTPRSPAGGSKKVTQYYVLLDRSWVQVNSKFAKASLKAGSAVKVPWSHGSLPHHASTDLIDDRELGLMMHNWHMGQGDPIYAAGSTMFAGKRTSQASMARALDAIRSLRSSKPRDKELRLIEKNLEHRVGVRKAAGAAKARPKPNPTKKRTRKVAKKNPTKKRAAKAPAGEKVVASSFERYNGGVRIKRRWGSSTVTRFYVYKQKDMEDAKKWKIIEGYGKTPGERKTYAIEIFKGGGGAPAVRGSNPAKKRTVKKAPAKKRTVKKAPAKKRTVKKAAKKAPAKKRVAKKAPCKSCKVRAVQIKLERPEESGRPDSKSEINSPNVWLKANQTLARWARTAPPGGAYEKVNFRIKFENGEVYKGRYELKKVDMTRANLADHIRRHVSVSAGRYNPGVGSDSEYKAWLRSSKIDSKAYAKFLDGYQIG